MSSWRLNGVPASVPAAMRIPESTAARNMVRLRSSSRSAFATTQPGTPCGAPLLMIDASATSVGTRNVPWATAIPRASSSR